MVPIHQRFDEEKEDEQLSAPIQDQGSASVSKVDVGSSDSHNSSEEDDDAPPEAVSTAAALSSTRNSRKKVAQTVRQQDEEKKAKRRRKNELHTASSKLQLQRQPKSEGASSVQTRLNIPLLPAEVLEAAERSEMLAQRSVDVNTTVPTKKRKLVETETKPIKDRRVGSTVVRVLAKEPSNLPPKSSKQARHTRETWLSGHRGRPGQTVSRRPWKSAFKT